MKPAFTCKVYVAQKHERDGRLGKIIAVRLTHEVAYFRAAFE